jgi:ABC-type transport system involved in multi-copper enzyme maturation permease subunit
MKTISALFFAAISLFFSAGLLLPALAQVRDFGSMAENVVPFYTLGVGLGLFGLWMGFSTVFKLVWKAKRLRPS